MVWVLLSYNVGRQNWVLFHLWTKGSIYNIGKSFSKNVTSSSFKMYRYSSVYELVVYHCLPGSNGINDNNNDSPLESIEQTSSGICLIGFVELVIGWRLRICYIYIPWYDLRRINSITTLFLSFQTNIKFNPSKVNIN